MTYRIVYTYGGAFEGVSFADTLANAKREADDLITRGDVEYAGVYDRQDHEVYQALAA